MTTAGTFWKQGKKAVAKAVEQYNTGRERDSSVPAWMKSAQRYEEMERRHQPLQQSVSSEDVTREAQLLGGPRQSRVEDRPAREPRWQETADAPTMSRAEKFRMLSKSVKMHQQEEEEQQYVSPARRRAPKREDTVPGPAVQTVRPEVARPSKPAAQAAPPKPQQSRKDTISKPKLVREKIDISPTALQMANASRQSGTEAFKRGDFSEASDHYTRALETVPPKHLLRTVILTNRAVCHIKVGDNKSALTDSEEVISIIGPTLGVGEEYEPGKSLRDIWIKAVTRKAEAFEHMEKFGDALEAYSTLMNNGASSTLVIEGRRRCAAALEPKPAIKPKATPSRPLSSASNGPISAAGKSALQRVKDEHKRVEAAETEKFALQESVDARINGWRHGNETNLRALLASLDNVLWPELGWKKASMADLVIPKKVKIIYMKAVAKTHPDKVPASATTEQKMIAEGVFVTLNKAWDDFKQSNGLA
jgi:tetratricopeptide (TPR) repeat protein